MEYSSPSNEPFMGFDASLYDKYFNSTTGDVYHEWLGLPKGTHRTIFTKDIIISITSHPGRIDTTWLAIESLMRQTYKPSRIVLTLVASDFGMNVALNNHNKNVRKLPGVLQIMQKRGLEIKFETTNWKVATKLIPIMRDNPRSVIVTADDDRIYSPNWLETLVSVHKKYPKCIVCPHVRRYCLRNVNSNYDVRLDHDNINVSYPSIKTHHTSPIDYQRQDVTYDEMIFGIFEGFAGVLYPVKCLSSEVFNINNFLRYAPIADDVWFQVMAILAGTKCISPSRDAVMSVNFPEITGTQKEGLFRQHLVADDVMIYECARAYGVLNKIGVMTTDDIICNYCNRPVKMDTTRGKIDCRGCLNRTPRIILCVGSYDHGNIGDNMYKEILSQELDYEVITCPDSVIMDGDRRYKPLPMGNNQSSCDLVNYDILVIGGGGIVRNFDGGIKFWLQDAIKHNKPAFMISVGFQDEALHGLNEETVNMLNQLEFITVRSIEDYKLLGQCKLDTLTYVVRDLCYRYVDSLRITGQIRARDRKWITVIQTGSCTISQQHVRNRINTLLREYPRSRLLVMNWGGVEYPGVFPDFAEYPTFTSVSDYYPDAKVLFGDSLSSKMVSDIHYGATIRHSDLTPIEAVDWILESHYVLTGRYHGLIIARSLGVPCEAMIFNHKCKSELEMGNHVIGEINHVKMITDYIQSAGWIYKWKYWTDNDRNEIICKLHDDTGVDVTFIQALDNRMLFEVIIGIRKM